MTYFLGVLLYLVIGLIIIVPLGRKGVLEVEKDNRWGIVWLAWPIALILMIYIVINVFVVLLIKWNGKDK